MPHHPRFIQKWHTKSTSFFLFFAGGDKLQLISVIPGQCDWSAGWGWWKGHSRCRWESSNVSAILSALLHNMASWIIPTLGWSVNDMDTSLSKHAHLSTWNCQKLETTTGKWVIIATFQSTRWRDINVSQFHWFRDRCQSQRRLPTTLMMTDRRVNTLHYASSLSGVTHTSDFRQIDFAWPQFDLKAGSMIHSSTWEKTTIKAGNTSAQEDLLVSPARNWL